MNTIFGPLNVHNKNLTVFIVVVIIIYYLGLKGPHTLLMCSEDYIKVNRHCIPYTQTCNYALNIYVDRKSPWNEEEK